jgi:hypothetical protein
MEPAEAVLPSEVLRGHDVPWPDFVPRGPWPAGISGVPRPVLRSHGSPVPLPLAYVLGAGADWRAIYVAHAHATTRGGVVPTTVFDVAIADHRVEEATAPVSRVHVFLAHRKALVDTWIVHGTDRKWSIRYGYGQYDGKFYREALACSTEWWVGPDFTYVPSVRRRTWGISCNMPYGVSLAEADEGHDIVSTFEPHPTGSPGEMPTRCTERTRSGSASKGKFQCALAPPQRRWDRVGPGVVRFGNGDRVVLHYVDGYIERIESFECSLTCPDEAFAGRSLGRDIPWILNFVSVAPGWFHLAHWPADDSTEEARAFWRYVAEGHIGWPPEVRACALLHAPSWVSTSQSARRPMTVLTLGQ